MKKIIALALLCTLAFTISACAEAEPQKRVTASFYPIYVLARNVFDGIDTITVDCMTAPETGCLHDYQLLVGDMMKLSESDALIICGAGMESYLDNVRGQFPALPVIDCSQGIALLCVDADHDHGHEDASSHAEDDEEAPDEDHAYNAHTWLDVQNAILMVNTIAAEAGALFPEEAERIFANAAAYTKRLAALDAELKHTLAPLAGKSIVTFHEAFPYFAQAYGLKIAAVVTEEHEESLSPARIAQVIQLVKDAGAPPLFTEPQYASAAAQTIAGETGARIFELDPIVTGDGALTAYEDGMRANAEALLKAFDQE